VLHTFHKGRDGAEPVAGLLFLNGSAFGTTYLGGDRNDAGTVFKIDASDNYTIVHRFVPHAPPGNTANPTAGLINDSAGNIYGTTTEGGSMHRGSVYKISAGGKISTLHSFTGPDGNHPYAGLLRDSAGNLYGTTEFGGSACGSIGCGTVFKVDTHNHESVLHAFTGGSDGVDPYGGVVRDRHGNLYGTTSGGGTSDCAGEGCGIIYKIDSQGHETVLHRFTNGADGGHPMASLFQGSNGTLFGTTDSGGKVDWGTIFKIDEKTGNEIVIYSFNGGSDAGTPFGGVIQDASGNLFGTTEFGGGYRCEGSGCGTVFEIDTTGKETILYRFTGKGDGFGPMSSVAMDSAGYLYGTTEYGGDRECDNGLGCGVAFKFKP
jgi:uncharacterized repeat protein (TIGR03803 family)